MRSLENGLPGAECIKKNETVIKINKVGMASKMRFEINVSIKITGFVVLGDGQHKKPVGVQEIPSTEVLRRIVNIEQQRRISA
ncbi:hypothetical protein GCM10011350_06050 [Marinomonas arctica]|nr:hypothetical protein GCM10011350_06050 [Marinomonas arctica]